MNQTESAIPSALKSAREASGPESKIAGLLGQRRHFLINKPYQLRAALLTTSIVLVLLVFLNIILYSASASSAALILEDSPELARMIQAQDRFQLYLIAFASVVFMAGVFVVSILETHKTAGPAYNLRERMREVERGRYAVRVKLRRGDRLRELEDGFNGMCLALRERAREETETLHRLAAQVERLKDADSTAIALELERIAETKRSQYI